MLTSSCPSAFVLEVATDFSRTKPVDGAVPLARCPHLDTEAGRLGPEGVIRDDTCATTASENRCKNEEKK